MKSAERTDAPRRTAQTMAADRQKRDDDVKRQIAKERQTLEDKVRSVEEQMHRAGTAFRRDRSIF